MSEFRYRGPLPHPTQNCGPLALTIPAGDRCPTCGTICGPSALDERRQRAREAFEAAMSAPSESRLGPLLIRAKVRQDRSRDAAIETATRVRITPEIAAAANAPAPMHDGGAVRARAVLEAAGFEVES